MARITRSHPIARYMRAGLSMRAAWAKYRGRRRGGRQRNMPGVPWSGKEKHRPVLRQRGPRGGRHYRPTLRRKPKHPSWVPTSFFTHVIRRRRRKSRR